MDKWVVKNKKADFYGLANRLGVDPVVVRLMANRDVPEDSMDSFLHGSLEDLNDPYLLKDAGKAASILKAAIEAGRKIRIIGDYDIDGINATYILYCAMTRLGADVDYRIPDRKMDGYGLNANLVRAAKEEGRELILTCDNGIAAYDEVLLAKNLGMDIIVTDHHEVPFLMEGEQKTYRVPPADAVVNPKQEDCNYPFSGICGAVVAWKLMMVLYEIMGHARSETDIYLENAAFATIGDVMELKDENRIMVREGLKAMQHTSNLGLHTLILQNKLELKELSPYHLGFVIGPCFNAGGRLDSAMRVMDLLLEQDPILANNKAAELISLNESRKSLTEQAVEEAAQAIETATWKDEHVYCIYLPTCHDSIAGIVAGRIRERYNRPTFVITGEEDQVKGSGRSIPGYHMFNEMTKVQDVFLKYGGHPLAAGFSLEKSRIDEMRDRLNAQETLTEEDLMVKVSVDMMMPIDYASFSLIEDLKCLEPFGNGNPKPIFAEKDAVVTMARVIGKNHNVLKLKFEKNGRSIDGIYFGEPQKVLDLWRGKFGDGEVDAVLAGRGSIQPAFAYYPEINSYMGRDSIQMTVSRFKE